jgi:hypothetical protein
VTRENDPQRPAGAQAYRVIGTDDDARTDHRAIHDVSADASPCPTDRTHGASRTAFGDPSCLKMVLDCRSVQ